MDSLNIAEQAIEVIANVLEVEFEEVDVNSRIVADLGADSLDIVDLSFSLGKKFSIKMPQKSVVMHAEDILGSLESVIQDNKFTDLGVELLRAGPNNYSEKEVYKGQSLLEIFTNTKVCHWINLCEEIIKSGLPGDDLIRQNLEALLEKEAVSDF